MKVKILFITLCFLGLTSVDSFSESRLSSFHIPIETEKFVLDNGLTVLISEMPNKETVSLYALVKTGSATEGKYLGTGISHFLEHMLFKGTDKRGVGEIAAEIQSAGGAINASTGYDYTIYTIMDLPSVSFDLGLDVLSDMIINSTFDEEELEKEREVVYNEMRLYKDRPSRVLSRMVARTAFDNHPYRYPIIGFKEMLAEISREDFVDYYHNRYSPNNIVVSIAGKVTVSSVMPKIEEAFKDFKRKKVLVRNLPLEPAQQGLRRSEEEYPTQLTRMTMAYQGVSVSEKDMYPLDVLAMILGQGETSRLHDELFRNRGLVRSVSSSNYTPIDRGLFEIDATLDKENIENVLQVVFKEIADIKKNGVENKELEKIKRQVISRHINQFQWPAHIAHMTALDEAFVGDCNFSKFYAQFIQRVTREDIKRVAQKYLNEDQLSIVILKPEEEKKQEDKKSHDSLASPVNKFELENGLILLVREDHSLPLVNVQVSFHGGTRQENESLNGLSALTSRLLPKSTTKRSVKEISESVESLGASFGGFSGKNSFGLRFQSLTDNLDFGINLIEEVLQNPAFDGKELIKEKEKMKTAIIARNDKISSITSRELRKILFPGHPFSFDDIGTLESIEKIKRSDIINFYESNINSQRMIVSVFGDVSTDDIVSICKSKFQWIKGYAKQQKGLASKPLNEFHEKTLRLDKKQAMIMIGFKGVHYSHEDYFGIEVMTSIMGSSFNGRLFQNIRENFGQAYSTGGQSQSSLDTGMISFYALTQEESVDEVYLMIQTLIQDLRKDGVTDTELKDIKSYLKGQLHAHLETNSSLSFKTSLDELYGLGYDFYLSYDKKIDAITKEDIQRLANQYLILDKAVAVISRPKEADSPSAQKEKNNQLVQETKP